MTQMYDQLARWYPLLTPPADYVEEARWYRRVLGEEVARAGGSLGSLLELGCGAGHNAVHMKAGLDCVLTDRSPQMLAHSQRTNPDCEHVLGDLRTLRLARTFDAVFVHDAVCYLTTRAELSACIATAAAHLRPGGVLLLAPDDIDGEFEECHDVMQARRGDDAVRLLEWSWDPDPTDERTRTEYVFTIREGGEVRVVHDVHHEGLFSEEVWLSLLEAAGFSARALTMPYEDDEYTRFVGVLRG